jgi:DNA-binding LacI/PurR family transcriptional regulator
MNMQKPICPASKNATIKDVAREAGVSITTVSNVLNGRMGAMSAGTLARVNEVIGSLGYHPSSAARSLVTGRAAGIAIVLAGRGCQRLFPAIETIAQLAAEAGYGLTLHIVKGADAHGKTMGILGERQVAGVVLVSSSGDDLDGELPAMLESSVPLVLLNGHAEVQDAWLAPWPTLSHWDTRESPSFVTLPSRGAVSHDGRATWAPWPTTVFGPVMNG